MIAGRMASLCPAWADEGPILVVKSSVVQKFVHLEIKLNGKAEELSCRVGERECKALRPGRYFLASNPNGRYNDTENVIVYYDRRKKRKAGEFTTSNGSFAGTVERLIVEPEPLIKE